MTKMTKAEALSYAIFALNTLGHPDASSEADLTKMDDNLDRIIKKLAKMRDKARSEAAFPARAKTAEEDHIDQATHALHFGIMGTDLVAGMPQFHTRDILGSSQGPLMSYEPISADQERGETVFRLYSQVGVLDKGGWPAWGEPASDGENTFHVTMFYDHLPDPNEAKFAFQGLAGRVVRGRVLDYACLTSKEDYSEELGTYLFHINENDAAYFISGNDAP